MSLDVTEKDQFLAIAFENGYILIYNILKNKIEKSCQILTNFNNNNKYNLHIN